MDSNHRSRFTYSTEPKSKPVGYTLRRGSGCRMFGVHLNHPEKKAQRFATDSTFGPTVKERPTGGIGLPLLPGDALGSHSGERERAPRRARYYLVLSF